MLTTTIGDELQLFNDKAKVIGLSLKDRGAILLAGHMGDAAYWMDSNGDWITSSYYMENLPQWMIDYQSENSVSDYLQGKNGKATILATTWRYISGKNGTKIIKSTPRKYYFKRLGQRNY